MCFPVSATESVTRGNWSDSPEESVLPRLQFAMLIGFLPSKSRDSSGASYNHFLSSPIWAATSLLLVVLYLPFHVPNMAKHILNGFLILKDRTWVARGKLRSEISFTSLLESTAMRKKYLFLHLFSELYSHGVSCHNPMPQNLAFDFNSLNTVS